ncbi:MAG: hypothetical protein CEN88_309 [Candidatus Berkelbacteria bacterium Licking1014_2]|uniref:Uncharacterized protein n=1 Tax=Candidatus Berkelbacteria bacterium Licking1014_2 TaxID=2017146 RepID=A0A554LUM2_9BACT|nr:MAG: hypothetical protein CEN88_309 [Candidatus Berkelbacteria bacterium Licking1014_2]
MKAAMKWSLVIFALFSCWYLIKNNNSSWDSRVRDIEKRSQETDRFISAMAAGAPAETAVKTIMDDNKKSGEDEIMTRIDGTRFFVIRGKTYATVDYDESLWIIAERLWPFVYPPQTKGSVFSKLRDANDCWRRKYGSFRRLPPNILVYIPDTITPRCLREP